MTTDTIDQSCMFCGRPARRIRCGRYRIGETAESRMRGIGVSRYAEMPPKIIGANRDGFRLVLPSCYRVPLADEREISIVAQTDRPADQPSRAPVPRNLTVSPP